MSKQSLPRVKSHKNQTSWYLDNMVPKMLDAILLLSGVYRPVPSALLHEFAFLFSASSTALSQLVRYKNTASMTETLPITPSVKQYPESVFAKRNTHNPNATATPDHRPCSFQPNPNALPILIGIATA